LTTIPSIYIKSIARAFRRISGIFVSIATTEIEHFQVFKRPGSFWRNGGNESLVFEKCADYLSFHEWSAIWDVKFFCEVKSIFPPNVEIIHEKTKSSRNPSKDEDAMDPATRIGSVWPWWILSVIVIDD
jgi:hypothetical protein